MKFSMVFEAQTADSSPGIEQQLLRDCVTQAVYGEQAASTGCGLWSTMPWSGMRT